MILYDLRLLLTSKKKLAVQEKKNASKEQTATLQIHISLVPKTLQQSHFHEFVTVQPCSVGLPAKVQLAFFLKC